MLSNCTHETVLRFLPPYVITDQEIDRAVRILTKIFKKVKYPLPGEAQPSA
jgi:acetylornithine/succinyldiaminopimelate/putrescine aminotransferase